MLCVWDYGSEETPGKCVQVKLTKGTNING